MDQIGMSMRNFLFFVSLFYSQLFYGQSLLEEKISLAQALTEYVQPDNKNFYYADFSSFYKSRTPSSFMNLFTRDSSVIKNIIKKIESITEMREKKGLQGKFVQSIVDPHHSTFIVWGDIYGAYHSLVRALSYLEQQGFINKELKIIKERCYFVFNGNVIDRSPYSLETLSIVVDLMEANPDAIFYIKGPHEDKEEWHSHSLARELQIRAQSLSKMIVPFSDIIDRFFNTLPLALYLTNKEPEVINLIRISNYDRTYKDINESLLVNEFYAQKNNIEMIPLSKKNENTQNAKKIALRAVVVDERRSITYKYSQGLLEGKTQEEATAWTLFSSPTLVHQQLFDAYFDAFVLIDVPENFTETTITLYHQDVREKEGFVKKDSFNIITTQRTQPGVPAQPDLLFAATMDFSKSTNSIGKRVDDGLRLRFEVEQDKGGIKGYQPRILTFDDQYTPNITREKVEFIKNELHIDKLIGSQGSPSLESYLDYVKKGDLLIMFPFTGAPIFRKPDLKYIIHGVRTSYQYEGEILAQYAYEELKAKRVAIFYQNDSFGKGLASGAQEYFKNKAVTLVDVPHERNDVTFEEQLKKIKSFDPEAILFFVTSPAARGLITQAGVEYFINRKLLASSVFEGAFEQFIDDLGLKFVLTSAVPNPESSNLEIVQEYRMNAKKYDTKIDKLSLEMYMNASILFDLIERLEGEITKEAIIETAENTHNYLFKGLELDFNPQTRELSHKMWLDTQSQEWKEIDVRSLSTYKNLMKNAP